MSPNAVQKRILVVDDDPGFVTLLAMVLRAEGHDIGIAVDGEDGLQQFRAREWDLVITDFQMPRMNGEDMTAVIKTEAPAVPVIMVTGSHGANCNCGLYFAFVEKPIRSKNLMELVNRAPLKELTGERHRPAL
jgi:DNA-binding NtrC family response regulator